MRDSGEAVIALARDLQKSLNGTRSMIGEVDGFGQGFGETGGDCGVEEAGLEGEEVEVAVELGSVGGDEGNVRVFGVVEEAGMRVRLILSVTS